MLKNRFGRFSEGQIVADRLTGRRNFERYELLYWFDEHRFERSIPVFQYLRFFVTFRIIVNEDLDTKPLNTLDEK